MPKTILYVDDEAPLRELVQASLEQEGYQIATAGDGAEAIRLLSTTSFDVVLLDLHMPEMGGIEVLRFLHGTESRPRVIVMSGDTTPRMRTLCADLGVADHLPKPYDFDDLINVLNRPRSS